MFTFFVAFGAIALAVLVFGFLVHHVRRLQRDPVGERLAAMARNNGPEPPDFWVASLAEQLPLTPSDNGSLGKELRRAGYYKPTARRDYLASRNALVLLVVIVAGAAAVMAGPERQTLAIQILLLGLLLAAIAWALPRVLLGLRADRRVRRISEGIPFALDLVTMSLAGGLTLQKSLHYVSREVHGVHPDLGVELAIIHRQSELSSLETAFAQFGQRIDTPEVMQLAALVTQAQRLGTNVAASITDYADGLRLQRRQMADARSSRVAVQMLMPITALLLPAVLITLWGPAVLQLWDFLLDMAGPGIPGL